MCWALTGGQSQSGFFGDFYIILYLSLARLWFCICFPSNTFSIDKVIIRKSRNTFEKVSKGSWALPQEGPDFRCIHMAPVWCLYMLTDGGSVGAPVLLQHLWCFWPCFQSMFPSRFSMWPLGWTAPVKLDTGQYIVNQLAPGQPRQWVPIAHTQAAGWASMNPGKPGLWWPRRPWGHYAKVM